MLCHRNLPKQEYRSLFRPVSMVYEFQTFTHHPPSVDIHTEYVVGVGGRWVVFFLNSIDAPAAAVGGVSIKA